MKPWPMSKQETTLLSESNAAEGSIALPAVHDSRVSEGSAFRTPLREEILH